MNVLVVGSGGREHALAWKLGQSAAVQELFCAPGNPGMARLPKARCVDIHPSDFGGLKSLIALEAISLTVIGPEDPLAAGIVDALSTETNLVFGPSAAAAQLEASKEFAKAFMARHDIPTARYAVFDAPEPAIAYVRAQGVPIVIKADGLAAGKGVTVARDEETAVRAIEAAMLQQAFGEAGARVVIEEFLEGEEASILAFCDGKHFLCLPASQDHKPAFDDDQGPNTGGMGAYAPAPVVSPALQQEIEESVIRRCVEGMAAEGTPYTGILYAGLMISPDGPKVVEFNCRFGDPETQVVLPLVTNDLLPVFEACCRGTLDACAIELDPGACVSVVLASGGYPGPYTRGRAIRGIQQAESDPDVLVFHAGTRVERQELLTNGGRVLNVTARGADVKTAQAKAYEAVRQIQFEGAHYRSDIGRKALSRLGDSAPE